MTNKRITLVSRQVLIDPAREYSNEDCHYHNFAFLSSVLSLLCPSSSCSATVRSGKRAGIIRRGFDPGTHEYFAKSVIPQSLRRKSSSSSSLPVTDAAGALNMPKIASEKISCVRQVPRELVQRSQLTAVLNSLLSASLVAPDSIACL